MTLTAIQSKDWIVVFLCPKSVEEKILKKMKKFSDFRQKSQQWKVEG